MATARKKKAGPPADSRVSGDYVTSTFRLTAGTVERMDAVAAAASAMMPIPMSRADVARLAIERALVEAEKDIAAGRLPFAVTR